MKPRSSDQPSNPRMGTKSSNEKAAGSGASPGQTCECCGNEYDKPLEIVVNGISHYFDSFECAIQKLAPTCGHCGCRIIGHGMEAGGAFFCCAHCAEEKGVHSLQDRS